MKTQTLLILWMFITLCGNAQKQLPKVMVQALNGETVEIRSLLNDSIPVVLAFWSTTCKPCILELDALAEQQEDWKEKVKFKIVAIATDDSRAVSKVRAMAGGRGWDFTILSDKNQELKRALNVNTIPQLFVLDKKGNIVYSHTGYSPGSELEVYDVLKNLNR